MNGPGGSHLTGPGKQVLPSGYAEISALNKMSAGLVMGGIENKEVSLVLMFHRSMVVVIRGVSSRSASFIRLDYLHGKVFCQQNQRVAPLSHHRHVP